MTKPFRFSTVAHIEYPAGRVATGLSTLREGIARVPPESLFFHITRVMVRYPRARDLPPNDFANWTAAALQNLEVAERLAFAGAQPLVELEDLRASLLRILDEALSRKHAEETTEAAAFRARGAQRFAESAEDLTRGGMPLLRLQREIGARWRRSEITKRLLQRTERSDATRRQEARAVVARFAGRLRKPPKGKDE